MDNSIIADYYEPLLTDNHFIPADDNNSFNSAGQCWRLSHEFGEGFYWVHAKKDLYDIKIHDFYFHDDFFMEFNLPECLSITQYESISGEELNPYRRLSAGCIKTFIGGDKPYKALIHKKIPIYSIGIEVMPAYYEGYLKKQQEQIARARAMEDWVIPDDIDYNAIESLRIEARQKLSAMRPRSLSQAGRIPGVNPADVAVLMVYLRRG